MATPSASGTVISYPISAHQNEPIRADFYQPSRFVISAISLGVATTVTTTEDINYEIGQEVRLIIPPSNGSYQLNGRTGIVISLPSSTQVVLNIDSSQNVDAFIYIAPPTSISNPFESAQIVAIGDVNTGATNSNGNMDVQTYIPASFINISPE